MPMRQIMEPVAPGAVFVEPPYCYRCPYGLAYPDCDLKCATDIERAIEFENPEMKSLHKKLLNLRSELFAHTDFKFKKPQIVNWSKGNKKWFPMAFKYFSYKELDNELPNIINLIKYVQKDLNKQINEYEKSF